MNHRQVLQEDILKNTIKHEKVAKAVTNLHHKFLTFLNRDNFLCKVVFCHKCASVNIEMNAP